MGNFRYTNCDWCGERLKKADCVQKEAKNRLYFFCNRKCQKKYFVFMDRD